MKSQLHHAAVNVCDLDWYAGFFQEVFGMEVRKTTGTAPNRKIWFFEGIQLNECLHETAAGSVYDHIAIGVPDIAETIALALKWGCTLLPDGSHWFALPNGVKIELMGVN